MRKCKIYLLNTASDGRHAWFDHIEVGMVPTLTRCKNDIDIDEEQLT